MMKKLGIAYLLIFSHICLAQPSISPEWLWSLGRISEPQISPDQQKVLFGITYYNLKENKGNRDLYILSLKDGKTERLTQSPGSELQASWRPDGKAIGYLTSETGELQLWEMAADGSSKRQVTYIIGGISGYKYSPDGKALCYSAGVKLDQNLKDKYPDLPKANGQLFEELMYRHWDSWSDGYYQHLFISDYSDTEVIREGQDILSEERYHSPHPPFGGMEDVAWSPDGKYLVYVSKKKTGTAAAVSTNTDLYLFNVTTQQTTNLTEGMEGYDLSPSFAPDGKSVAWLSMAREGFEADKEVLYTYNFASGERQALSNNYPESVNSFKWSEDGKKIYFTSMVEATSQVFELILVNKKINQLTKGDHDINEIHTTGKWLIGTLNTMLQPTEMVRIDIAKGTISPLTSINKEALVGIKMPTLQKRWVKTTDGKDMLTWVILPPDFNASKKYPALLYCQGGPQSAVSQFFSYRWNFALMASKGYVVVAPNRRGLPGFGREWNDAISGDWGGQAIRDYLSAIDDVSKESFVDNSKLGAVGASYGGYSVYQLAGVHNNRFKAFIAHCGIFNLESWYGSTEELFFANWDMKGAYWDEPKPKSYTQYSPHLFVKNWNTPMLVIHGEKDFRVPITQGMEAFQAAQLKEIPSQFLYFPEENHWILKPQNSVLWHRVFFEWLDRWLK